MGDVFDRIAGRAAGGSGTDARLTKRRDARFAPGAPETAAGHLDAVLGPDRAGQREQELSDGEPRPRHFGAEHGHDVIPGIPAPSEAVSPAGDVFVTSREATVPRPALRRPAREEQTAPLSAPDDVSGTESSARRRRPPSPPGTPARQGPRGERPSIDEGRPHAESRQRALLQTEPGSATSAPAVRVPPAHRRHTQRPKSTRSLEPEELLREHVVPALAAQGTLRAAAAADRLAAVGLEHIEVPTGGDVHVHIERVELRQPVAPARPEPEPSHAGDRAGNDRVDHADYLARQQRRWS